MPDRVTTPLLPAIHHVALICSDYARSKAFYSETLGFRIIREVYRETRDSWKLDLEVSPGVSLELFSFPNPPPRPSRPEAQGLRHLAFAVPDIEAVVATLLDRGVSCEPIRVDEYTGRRFTFFADPDGLPIELYEQKQRGNARRGARPRDHPHARHPSESWDPVPCGGPKGAGFQLSLE